MNTAENGCEIRQDRLEGGIKQSPPRDDHIIMAGAGMEWGNAAHSLTQPAAHAVALHGAAGLAGNGHSQSRRRFGPGRRIGLQGKQRGLHAPALRGRQKIRPAGQARNGNRAPLIRTIHRRAA